VGILVTFVPPKVTARRGMSDMPTRGTAPGKAQRNTAATPEGGTAPTPTPTLTATQRQRQAHSDIKKAGEFSQSPCQNTSKNAILLLRAQMPTNSP